MQFAIQRHDFKISHLQHDALATMVATSSVVAPNFKAWNKDATSYKGGDTTMNGKITPKKKKEKETSNKYETKPQEWII